MPYSIFISYYFFGDFAQWWTGHSLLIIPLTQIFDFYFFEPMNGCFMSVQPICSWNVFLAVNVNHLKFLSTKQRHLLLNSDALVCFTTKGNINNCRVKFHLCCICKQGLCILCLDVWGFGLRSPLSPCRHTLSQKKSSELSLYTSL